MRNPFFIPFTIVVVLIIALGLGVNSRFNKLEKDITKAHKWIGEITSGKIPIRFDPCELRHYLESTDCSKYDPEIITQFD